ncbi:MAG: glycosyltransferase [Omnitrophica bacterium]|nr:glycosyltransferase [Candidatus Omnitrophota bacterium]
MDATIIIPSYRSERTIEQCLQSLSTQNTKFTYEIIVIDSSPNGRIDSITRRFSKVKLLSLIDKAYAGIARNIGSMQAQGELLVFIDADIVVPSNWLDKVIKYYKMGHNVFSGAIDIWDGERNNLLNKLEWFYEFSEFKSSMQKGERWCLPAAALAIKKVIFQNEQFHNMETSEDVDLTIRLRNKGNGIYFNPELKVFHIFHTNFRGLLRKAFNFGMSNMQLRCIYHISGSRVVKNKVLMLIAIPSFALIKFIKISWRNIKYNEQYDSLLYIRTSPLMIVVIIMWMLGAYKIIFN